MSRPAKRPGSVTFVAIVLFLFGTIYLLNSLATGGVTVFLPPSPEPAIPKAKIPPDDIVGLVVGMMDDMPRFFAKEVPHYTTTVIAFSIGDFLFGIAQIACGVGVLRLRPSARSATLLLAPAKLTYVVGYQVYFLIMIMPAQVRFTELHAPEMPGGGPQPFDLGLMTRNILFVELGFAIFMQLVLTVLILWLLNTAAAKAAFAGELESPSEPEEKPKAQYAGYEDDDAPA